MTTVPLQVGLIGFGLAGRCFHAPLIAAEPRLHLAAVATSRAAEAAALWPDAAICRESERVIRDPAIDLIVIAAPNASHGPLARAAIEAGKHVVVDKPFVIDPAEGEALEQLADADRRMVAVFHNRRWDADFLTLRRLLGERALGEVRDAAFAWDRFRPAIKPGWREQPGDGAGLLADLGPHLADQALVLFGVPDRVSGDLAMQRDGVTVDDWFAVTLHYGERRVLLAASSLAAAPRPRMAVHGTRGSYVKHGIDPQEAVLRAGGTPADPGYGIEPAEAWGILAGADNTTAVPSERGDWRRFYAGVAAAILDGVPPPVTAAEALAGLRLLTLARASAAAGRTLAWSEEV
jgi:scyllo-inositol 2-dehydrogenase (NADP+)